MECGQEETMANDRGDKKNENPLTETKRVCRNMNEKKRRDRFNLLINELAAVISPANRNGKYEKINILKDAISCLRSHQASQTTSLGSTAAQSNWQTSLVGGSELSQLVVEAMNGFVISLDCTGIITFVSDSILSAVGYRASEMVQNSIAEFLDQTDRSSIFVHLNLLQREGQILPSPALNFSAKSKPFGKAIAFQMNLLYGPHIDKKGYVTINCCGQSYVMSHNTSFQHVTQASSPNAKLQLVIIGASRFPKPNIIAPLANTKAREFTSQLTLGWTFTQVDPKALLIVGYSPTELIDKSAYLFIHEDDIANIMSYHEMLGRKGRVITCYYRFLTKGQTWVWLRSSCYVSYNQWNSKPEYVTSTTTAVNYEEVCANQENLLKEDKLKFQNVSKKSHNVSAKNSLSRKPTGALTTTKPQELSQEQSSMPLPTSTPLGDATRPENFPGMDISEPNHVAREQQSKNFVPELIESDEDLGMETESVISETSDLGLSTMKAPEGLSPAQSKLHMQLQGKHRLLEKSIKYQIDELERIKKQIEINKQLWEFNKQLQEKKSGENDKPADRLINLPAKRGLGSDSFSGTADTINETVKRSLVQSTSSDKYSIPCPVEIPVSYYVDIPPINLGNPPDLCGMEEMDQSVMDGNTFPSFSTSMPSISTQEPYSFFPPFQPQGR